MLQLSDLSVMRGGRLLFSNASLQLHAGQRMALVGANGCGKTSRFDVLRGQLDQEQGSFTLPLRARLGRVSQHSPSGAQAALEFVIDGDQELRDVQSALEVAQAEPASEAAHGLWERMEILDGFSAPARAARLLAGLGFSESEFRKPVDAFSGGWKMRLNLAQVLMGRADVLLLDEPTNHLDLPAIVWLEQYLKRFQGILLLISHDREFLDATCDRVAHIEHQEFTVYTGNYSQFEAFRAARLAQQQSLYLAQQKAISHIQSYVDRFRYKASKARQAQSRLKTLERMQRIAPAHVDSPFRFQVPNPEKQPAHLLHLDQAGLGYESGRPVLLEVRLQLEAGQRLGILGLNGAGKSTLVRALADGSTLLDGERIQHRDTRIGYFAQQQMELLVPARSAMDHLRERLPNESEQQLRDHLGAYGFSGDRIFEAIEPFSGGEKARLVLALLIAQRPNVLLLDEPTNHLDLEMRQALTLALSEYEGAIVLIAHDRHLLRAVCDEYVLVHDGRVQEWTDSLDAYTDWLAGSAKVEAGGAEDSRARNSRRDLRRERAQARTQLQPLSRRLAQIEKELEDCHAQIRGLENALQETALYQQEQRKPELQQLLQRQAAQQQRLQQLEQDWLQAGEALEQAHAASDP